MDDRDFTQYRKFKKKEEKQMPLPIHEEPIRITASEIRRANRYVRIGSWSIQKTPHIGWSMMRDFKGSILQIRYFYVFKNWMLTFRAKNFEFETKQQLKEKLRYLGL